MIAFAAYSLGLTCGFILGIYFATKNYGKFMQKKKLDLQQKTYNAWLKQRDEYYAKKHANE